MVQTSTDETEVILCDNNDSKSVPSKLPSALKISEVCSAKSMSLFKQKVTKLISEDQGQQSAISQVSKVQDKLKCEEQVPAQEEKKENEDNLKHIPTEICSEEGKEINSKNSREIASSIGSGEEIAAQPSMKIMDPSVLTPAEPSTASSERRRPKPNLLRLQQDTKFYMSIDDLSPEYSGLPFVKKLKILNERQKLAELEQKVAHVFMRSSSLDSSNAISGTSGGSGDSTEYPLDLTNLTRSHSEASAMQYVRSQQLSRDSFSRSGSQMSRKDDEEEESASPPQRPAELPQTPASKAPVSLTSPESNETLERRNLKSILKKLSASSLFSRSTEETKTTSSSGDQPEGNAIKEVTTTQPASKPLTVDMHKLLRAPTIEGYAARHSKLTKSVTFNRDTLQSPPATATTPTNLLQEPSGSLFPLPAASDVLTVGTVVSTCITTSTTTNLTIITPSAVSSASPTDFSEASVPQHETFPPVTTPGTVVSTTTSSSVASQPTISTVSPVSPLAGITSEPSQVSAATDMTQTPADAAESALKKKPNVSFLVQHPHQIPLSANEKNFFRPSLLLPSHACLEEEYFNEVIVGIKQVIQGHLEEIQNKFQSQFQSLELEVKRRDEIISQLQKRIHELEHPDSTEKDHEGDDRDLSDTDDGSDQPFMRGDSVDTVLMSPPPALPDDLEEESGNNAVADEAPYHSMISPSHHILQQPQTYRHSWEDHSEEETLELLDLPSSISPQHMWCVEDGLQNDRDIPIDSVALDLGSSDTSSSSSSSSDSSNDEDDAFATDDLHSVGHNQDWEVQMLARELERREGISRLEDEVRDLKVAVSSSDLSHLTSSELDILEQVLVAKDRKVRAAARALSLDSDDSYLDERSLHPVIRHKPELHSPSLSSALNKQRLLKQRSTNGGGSIENLLYRTSLLKNRLFSASTKGHKPLVARSLEETPDRSHKTTISSSERRNRSASSGSITPVGRTSNFALPSASSLMRGLGTLVRNSASTSTSQNSSHNRRLSATLLGAVSNRAAVPTISSTCGEVSPDPSHHTNDPPPPDL
ncbi:hypothetical protein B7P43_G08302 [Cryptotermes secundus]|uniref:Uncharacterized protein n=3 Tax=Cryptotermes secundus TaxID=105785 RepID=A0A2J7QH30_9NEOP|nr:hypothetical protein B7P43_G08302 [Cryptotermes secundus]